jgi:murein DD-endopeptidase MepM/ murein hydrolase activator NlpD
MKKLVIKIFIAIFTIFSLINFIYALELILKLPYPKGERFIVTQGYKTLPTHKPGSLDEYALDFDQGGCKAYGKPVLAVASGIVIAINDINKNRSDYGNYVDIEHTPGLKSRYAHLEKFIVTLNQEVKQGEIIGYVGNTGKVFGEACPEHPGTHLHFAMYQRQPDGKLIAYKPEPMSGYTNFVAGNWYTSDNEIYQIKFAEENKSSESSSSNNFWQNLKSLFSGLWQNFINSINNLLGLNQQEEQNEAVFSQTPTTTYQEEFNPGDSHQKLIPYNPHQIYLLSQIFQNGKNFYQNLSTTFLYKQTYPIIINY